MAIEAIPPEIYEALLSAIDEQMRERSAVSPDNILPLVNCIVPSPMAYRAYLASLSARERRKAASAAPASSIVFSGRVYIAEHALRQGEQAGRYELVSDGRYRLAASES